METVDPRVFPAARSVLDHLLDEIDLHAPGLIVGAYITGSIALGDGRSDRSDIDLVLVRDSSADNATTMATLDPVLADLRQTHPHPSLDGLVLGERDLETGPDGIAGDRPIIFDSVARLGPDGSGRNPVTWQTLRQCGITYRGTPGPDRLWHDPARLDAWTRENLESYWRSWLAKSQRLAAHPDLGALIDEATEWGILGVTRLHYTLATGQVTSKHGAGVYALQAFPARWHPVIEEALRIREGNAGRSLIPDRMVRVRDIHAYMTMVIDTALELPQVGTSPRLNNP